MAQHCLKQDCELEAQYICLCLSSEACYCKFHLEEHLMLSSRAHAFDSIFIEPEEWNKTAILNFLRKEESKKETLKKIVITYFSQNCCNHCLREIDSDLKEIDRLIEETFQISENMENSQVLQHETERMEEVLINSPDPYTSAKLFCRSGQLRHKRFAILNKVSNDPETEQDYRENCRFYENHTKNSLLSQAYEEYQNAYKKLTSLYYCIDNMLYIYDTENEREEAFEIPDEMLMDPTYMIHLPNGELFFLCYDNNSSSTAFIIDRNYKVQEVRPGIPIRCIAAIYYKRSVYCFGLNNSSFGLYPSRKFDLDKNCWSDLAQIYKCDEDYDDDRHNSVALFNGNILISRYSRNLLLYSVDIDSFSQISYEFSDGKRKILINAEERLYLIECSFGGIYESEVGDEYAWKRIAKSTIWQNLDNVYWSYNKGWVYILAVSENDFREYLKFDLSQKALIENACYSQHLALKLLNGNIEVIKCYNQDSNLDSYHGLICTNEWYTLGSLGQILEKIEQYTEAVKINPMNNYSYLYKAEALSSLGKNLEAIECLNKSIDLDPENWEAFILYGEILQDLENYAEAIEFYDKAIKIYFGYEAPYFNKGYALSCLDKYLEAIDCYNSTIEINDGFSEAYLRKGEALHYLNRNLEAMECENKAIELWDQAFTYFCYRGRLLNDIGQEAKAINDFNKAYDVLASSESYYASPVLIQHILHLIKMLSNLQESAAGFKEEFQTLKNANLQDPEKLKEILDKEMIIKERHSKFLKAAVECIDLRKNKSAKAIIQNKIEAMEHSKAMTDIVGHLSLVLSFNNKMA